MTNAATVKREADRWDQIRREAFNQAYREASQRSWPVVVIKKSVVSLGEVANTQYLNLVNLDEITGADVQSAIKILWVMERSTHLKWSGWLVEKLVEDDSENRRCADLFEAGFYGNKAFGFADELAESNLQQAFSLDENKWSRPLQAIAVFWFLEADSYMESGNTVNALNTLTDALLALDQFHSLSMWDAGYDSAQKDDPEIKRKAENRLKQLRQESMTDVRKLGTDKRKADGEETRRQIHEMNSDLLKEPRSKGWTLDARANYIAQKTGLKESYVRKIIATPRKIKQT